MSAIVCETTFAKEVNEKLQQLQDKLFELRASGRTEDQSVSPSLIISFEEIKELTGRKRLKGAVIENFTRKLRRYGNEVSILKDLGAIEIVKPAKDLKSHNDSYKDLCRQLSAIETIEDLDELEDWKTVTEEVADDNNQLQLVSDRSY